MKGEAQQKLMDVQVWTMSGSPFGWKTLLALEHRAVSYTLHELTRDDLARPEIVALSPRRRVPVLQHGDLTLIESLAIIDYIEDGFSGAPLWPKGAGARATARRFALECDAYVYPAVRRFAEGTIFDMSRPVDEEAAVAARDAVGAALAPLLPREGPVTVADFSIVPLLAFLDRIDERRPGYDAASVVPRHLRARQQQVEAQPYFGRTYPSHWRRS